MANINYEISPRSFELIRDRVGLILADELQVQAAITYEDLFLAPVYVQRSKAVDVSECPMINVSVDSNKYDNHTIVDSDVEVQIFIDIFGTSSYAGQSESERGDTLASFEAQRLAGVVESILMNPIYDTLGFAPQFIMRSIVQGSEPGTIERGDATNLAVTRITLLVKAGQTEPASDPISDYTLQTQVLISNTARGYLYSGINAPVPPVLTGEIQNTDGLVLGTVTIGEIFTVGDSRISNSDDSDVVLLPATESLEIGDITYNIYIDNVLIHTEDAPNYFN